MNCPQFNCHILYLILFLLVGEVAILHVRNIGHHRVQVSITTQETRTESVVHAKHVLNHQYLTVYVATGTDTDNRYGQFGCYAFGKGCGNLFEYNGKTASNRWASRISFSASASSLARTV